MGRYFSRIFSFIIAISIFLSCSITSYAFPKRLLDGTWVDVPWSEIGQEVSYFIQYGLSMIGVVVNGDFEQWLKNSETYKDLYDENGRLAKNISIDTETGNITYKKEIMEVLKSAVDDYAKEHEPYYMVNTLTLDDCLGNPFTGSKLAYDTMKNLLTDSPSGVIAFGFYYSTPTQMFFVDIGHDFKNVSPVKAGNNNLVAIYNNETWGQSSYTAYEVNLAADGVAIKTAAEFKEKADRQYNFGTNYDYPIGYIFRVYSFNQVMPPYPYDCRGSTNWLSLITKEKRRIRVFNTYGDFQNYTLGKRSVYYTSNYYDYVPEDLTVTIDDLEKTVDDLQKVIDELLKQIQDDTSEKEIEELLKQILEEIRNGQGAGGGGGSGGGDVTVDIDLSTTNGLLSKILAKVTQIFDKMSETVEGATDAAWEKMQETLDEILKQIKKIKHWTVADTLIDGVTGLSDMITDWVTLIGDLLEDLDGGAETTVAAISSTMDDATKLLKTKFPFCIPWDIAFLVTFLSHEPEVPVFNLPIKIESVGIDECIVVDLTDFSGISTISRTLLTLIYCYGLLNLTMKIMPMVKEET